MRISVSGCSLRPRIGPSAVIPCVMRRPAIGQSELTKSGSVSPMRLNTGLPIFIELAKNSFFTP